MSFATAEELINLANMLRRVMEAKRSERASSIGVYRAPDNLLGEPCVMVDWSSAWGTRSHADIESAIRRAFALGMEAVKNETH